MAEIPDWLMELKHGRVVPFTRTEEFGEELDKTFSLIIEQMEGDRERYSQDWASVGLPGLANGCLRKASRVFDLFVMDMPGKDKPEDELRDNMMLAIYSYIYYKMLTAEENGEEVSLEDQAQNYTGNSEDEDREEDQIEEAVNSGLQDPDSSPGFLSKEGSDSKNGSEAKDPDRRERPKLLFSK